MGRQSESWPAELLIPSTREGEREGEGEEEGKGKGGGGEEEKTLLYLSNRNEPGATADSGDTIAVYTPSSPSPSPSSTQFKKIASIATGQKSLRGMLFDPSGKYLVVGGLLGGGVKVFERVSGGANASANGDVGEGEGEGGLKEVAKLEGEGAEGITTFLWF